jgi:hypothetical protein
VTEQGFHAAPDAPPLLKSSAGEEKLWLVFAGPMLAVVLAALDQNIVATALPHRTQTRPICRAFGRIQRS